MGKIVQLAYFCTRVYYKRPLMINRFFFIFDPAVVLADLAPPEENVYYSIWVSPGIKSSREDARHFLENTSSVPLAVTLEIREPLTGDHLRSIAALLFIHSSLRIGGRPVINLSGGSPELLSGTAAALSGYLSLQGYADVIIHILLPAGESPAANGSPLFRSAEALTGYYKDLLQSDACYNRDLFFYMPPGEMPGGVLPALQQAESDLAQRFPQLYSLIRVNSKLDRELQYLCIKYQSTEAELRYQKQYLGILRSDHPTREIQDYYTREYEILPLWYKRFGHILKVLTGKRTFRSLFRDDVKKYKV
jgi:hypothetical protein